MKPNTITEETSLSYTGRKLQGYFNAKKNEFLQTLKQRGTFLECCKDRGFVYAIKIVAFNEEISLQVGLNNGEISVLKMTRHCQQKKAI